MNINERILHIANEVYKGNISEFCRIADIKQATMSNIVAGRMSKPSFDIINSIVTKTNINSEWLITGSGTMIKGENQTCLINEGIPLYRSEAAAGFGTAEFNIENKDIEAKYKIKELDSASFMLHVRGDSMSPTYGNGDIIAVKTVLNIQSIQWSKPHLISSRDHGLLVKRIYDNGDTIIAVSDNSTYKPICISKDDISGLAFIMGSVRFENY